MKIMPIVKSSYNKIKLLKSIVGICMAMTVSITFTLAANIKAVEDDETYIISQFMYEKLGFGDIQDIWNSNIYKDWSRTDNPDAPGYYYEPPVEYRFGKIKADSTDKQLIKPPIKSYLNPVYYSDILLDSLNSVNLHKLKRREFFGCYLVDNISVRLSGWYGKFIHIIVAVDYDSKSNFLMQAQKYFNLGELEEKHITLSIDSDPICDDEHEFFYSYNDGGADYKLTGYSILEDDEVCKKCRIAKTVIDLKIYIKEQSDGE